MFLNRSYTGRLGLGLLLLGVLFQACSEPAAPSGEAPGSQARREENGSSLSQESPGVGVGEAGLDLKVPLRNVVLITLDTLRWDYVSCYRDDKASTPYIDELAARGVRFEQAVAQVPLTLPSHASILTGTYPQVHGVRDIGGFVLGSEIPTMATIMKGAGYDTAAFVGAAVLHRRFQLSHGFDLYSDDMMVASGTNRLPGVVAEIRADVVSDRVISWLEARAAVKAKKPFFVWAHYYDPLRSYDPPEPYKSRYAQDPYAGETAYTDEQVGRIFDFLEERGLMEDTLIVLLSDHGESLGEHDEFTHGIFIYESTMRIPMVVAGPGIPGGVTVEEQVRSIDVMPT
ncbi:MAG: sulfatase, partial [Acidobacteriota bacterium]